MDWWRKLGTTGQIAVVIAAVAVLAGAVTAGIVLTREGRTVSDLPSRLVGATETPATGDDTGTADTDTGAVPAEPSEKQPSASEPTEPERVFGALRGIRDESGGSWQEVWVDIDTAEFLTGNAALDYLTSKGDQDFYDPGYWYVRDEGVAITSFQIPPSGQGTVDVTMYTYPTVPAIGFYGPSMDAQQVTFGQFYDAIYMDEDSSHLLGRYYWFTVEEGIVVAIEEQPRDPYYEP